MSENNLPSIGPEHDFAPLTNREPSRTLLQAYKETLFHASAAGLASEVPGASWRRVWIGLAIVSVMNVIVQLMSLIPSLRGPVWIVISAIAGVVGFFLGTLFVYWLCRSVSGVWRTGRFGQDFLVLSYLLSLVAVPVSLVMSLFSIVPSAGWCASFIVALYGFRLQYFAIRASMQMSRGNARTVIIIEFVLLIVVFMVIAYAVWQLVQSGLRWI